MIKNITPVIQLLVSVFFSITMVFSENIDDSLTSDVQAVYGFEEERNGYISSYQKNLDLVDMGRENKIIVTDREIAERLKIYEKVFKDNKIIAREARDIIIIEKYLQQIIGIMPDDYSIKRHYEKFIEKVPQKERPLLSEIYAIVFSMALLYHESTQVALNKKREEIERIKYEVLQKNNACWTTEELMLKGNPDECIALDVRSNECIVMVKHFNSAISSLDIPKSVSKDSAQSQILQHILSNIYFTEKAIETGFSDKQDIKDQIEVLMRSFKYRQKFLNLGKLVTNDDDLFLSYVKYYDKLFKNREELYLDVLGSSDSALIDSIYQWLSLIKKKENPKDKKRIINDSIKLLPWQRSNWNDLPDELVFPTENLHLNEFTEPVKTNYGFFIIHVGNIEKFNEIPFEDAKKQLVYLATRDKWQNIDSIREEKAYQIYTSTVYRLKFRI